MSDVDLFKNITVLSLEQATVLPYLTLRLAEDGARVIRLEHPVYGDPNRRIGDDVLKEDRMFSYYLSINAGKKALTLDLAAPEGMKVAAALPGKVISAGYQRGYGRTVLLQHSGGLQTRYAHLGSINVKAGDGVASEETLGTVGNTGRSTSPHLHFEVIRMGEPVDPLQDAASLMARHAL